MWNEGHYADNERSGLSSTLVKKILIVLFSHIPVMLVAAGWWSNWISGPLNVILLSVFAEMISFSLMISKKIWTKLEPDIINAVADWLKIKVLNLFSDFEARYNKHIVFSNRVFNVKGLRTRGTYTLDVDTVFVQLSIAPKQYHHENENFLALKSLEGSHDIWHYLRQLARWDGVALCLIGPPGSGKTTLLQHIALQFAYNNQILKGLRHYIPVFLFLREHAKTIIDRYPSLPELLDEHYSKKSLFPGLNPPLKWFDVKLRRGKCIILLDGLDEIPLVYNRQRVSEWVEKQILNYPKCKFIITARPHGYYTNPLSNAHTLEVLPFTPTQSAQFIRNWYLANKIISYGKDDEGVRLDAERDSDDLLQRIRKQPALESLTVNPLLLTMIATVHNHRGVLPGRRVELYSEIIDVLLGHWQLAKEIPDDLTPAQKRDVLQPLAAHMMGKKSVTDRRTIHLDEALSLIEPYLLKTKIPKNTIPQFFNNLQANTGLFIEKELDVWSFAHFTFQEYLCASYWHDSGITKSWDYDNWAPLVADGWWHETIRLFSAQDDATPIIDVCLRLRDVNSLTLASDIIEEALKLEASKRQLIENILYDNLESKDSNLQRQAAQVYLNHRLRNGFHRLDDKREIDSTLVTCAEYQLFIDFMRDQNQFVQPDHWRDFAFSEGSARSEILGITPRDAKKFCDWVGRDRNYKYYIPTKEDINEIQGGIASRNAFWTSQSTLATCGGDMIDEIKDAIRRLGTGRFRLSILNQAGNGIEGDPAAYIFSLVISHVFGSRGKRIFSRLNFLRNTKQKMFSKIRTISILALLSIIILFGVKYAFDTCLNKPLIGPIVFGIALVICALFVLMAIINISTLLYNALIFGKNKLDFMSIGIEEDYNIGSDGIGFDEYIRLERSLEFTSVEPIRLAIYLSKLSSYPDHDKVDQLVQSRDIATAIQFLKGVSDSSLSDIHEMQITLLEHALVAANETTFIGWRKAHRRFVMKIASYADERTELFAKSKKWTGHIKTVASDLLLAYQVNQLREDGALPVWEGLLLARAKLDA